MDSTRSSREHAFTLVEAIVAMVIGMVVLAMILMVLMTGRKNADSAIAGERLARQTREFTQQLAADVRSARAPGRDQVDDVTELADLLATPGVTSVSDVLVARPDELQLRTKARAATSMSCVWWRRDAAGRVTRAIHADMSCAGAPTRTDDMGIVPRVTHGAQRGVPSLVTYGMMVDDDPSSGDPARCHVTRTASPASTSAIVEIGASVDLRADVRTSTRRQASVELTGIRSRDEGDYRAALGCAW
jgi:type II secretory pathway pseudopilin PulG